MEEGGRREGDALCGGRGGVWLGGGLCGGGCGELDEVQDGVDLEGRGEAQDGGDEAGPGWGRKGRRGGKECQEQEPDPDQAVSLADAGSPWPPGQLGVWQDF